MASRTHSNGINSLEFYMLFCRHTNHIEIITRLDTPAEQLHAAYIQIDQSNKINHLLRLEIITNCCSSHDIS